MNVKNILGFVLSLFLVITFRITMNWLFNHVERRAGTVIAFIFFAGLLALLIIYFKWEYP